MTFYTVITGLAPVELAIASAERQSVKNTIIAVIDDAGEESIGVYENKVVWKRDGRHHKAKNIYDAINTIIAKNADTNDVLCLLDGDDFYNGALSLEPVQREYKNRNVWLTYGSYKSLSGRRSRFCGGYSLNHPVRMAPWRASHLKTFRYGLFRHLPASALKNKDGGWLKVCSDLAIMFPLMELAGQDRCRFIPEFIYAYNDCSELNDHKVRGEDQIRTDKWLRSQKSFPRIRAL